MNSEAEEIAQNIPTDPIHYIPKLPEANAYVYKEVRDGKPYICILFRASPDSELYGWIGAHLENFQGDVAPFAG